MLLKNIFETSFRRRSLICYISDPFQRQLSFPVHSNERQVKSIAMAIRDLQFNVDVCAFTDIVEPVDHDLVFGQGSSFVDIVGRNTSAVTVYYATEAHSFHPEQGRTGSSARCGWPTRDETSGQAPQSDRGAGLCQ